MDEGSILWFVQRYLKSLTGRILPRGAKVVSLHVIQISSPMAAVARVGPMVVERGSDSARASAAHLVVPPLDGGQ